MKFEPPHNPMRVRVHAPVRIADVGGWTDTWFAEHGAVCNVAVGPGVHVTITSTIGEFSVLELANLDSRFVLNAAGIELLKHSHPMLAECWLRHGTRNRKGRAFEISIDSSVPPGSSLGTSAAVGVALITALRAAVSSDAGQVNPIVIDPQEIATLAHQAETRCGLESGVQDHAAAGYGGVNLIDVTYPNFRLTPLKLSAQTLDELNRRLITVYFGRPHESSVLHEMVIARLETTGSGATELEYLRGLAKTAAGALEAGDLGAYGDALMGTVEGQRALHPGLISPEAELALSITQRFEGRLKVNGAGGPGGSVTILGPHDPAKCDALRRALADQGSWMILDLQLWSTGVTID